MTRVFTCPRALAALAVLAATILLTVGCGDGAQSPGGAGTGELQGAWVLEQGEGPEGALEVAGDAEVTLEIDGREWRGTAACNDYSATADVDGSQVALDELVRTEMACPEPGVMELEDAYLEALSQVDAYRRTDDALLLSGEDVRLRYVRAEAVAD